jgi:hypothetical protein
MLQLAVASHSDLRKWTITYCLQTLRTLKGIGQIGQHNNGDKAVPLDTKKHAGYISMEG